MVNDRDGAYDAFERLYMHHTVASLAQRIDFELSMLDDKKHFRSPARCRSRRRNSIGVSNLTGSEPTKAPSRAPSRPRSLSRIRHTSTDFPSSSIVAPPNTCAVASALLPKDPIVSSQHTSSSSAMLSVDSKASTAMIQNTGSSEQTHPRKPTLDSKYSSLSIDVTDSDVGAATGNLLGVNSLDTEDDLLATLLDSSTNNLAEPGAFGSNEEDELVFDDGKDVSTSLDLEEQEAAMTLALERAVEEFETAAAVSSDPFYGEEDGPDGAELTDQSEMSHLLDAAAKTVATINQDKRDM